ncbi:cytochrome c oxidase subunit 3 [Cerasicoccus arenae]|uniref:Heme-copper oxidase subunit III family profile domain-containing protein n=1 Tax=Cerasicoccus arenae TaxID=424488 RepID=A0A8J3GEY3_9BACT|nr:cytochrome c oxidase subunit 3 [Cerasicoccus arenae]GHC12876.1 hypothetical protein GCM10007047_32780 [Cerasicoccus arenae]
MPSANPPLDDQLLEEIHADQNTNTGIENKKLIMWLFLASDCMFFGTLISTHLIYRKLYPFGHPEEGAVNITGTFDIELTSFSTFILLMSSFLMALAVSSMHKGAIQSFRNYTFGVIIFGLIFLAGQVYEFQHFYHGQGWYDWKVSSNAGQVIVGNEKNKLLFHDVANTAAAKEGFGHEQFGLELLSFTPAEGADLAHPPITFKYEVELPDEVGNAPETFYGEYIYNPTDPHASQVVVLSEIPPPPVIEEAKEAPKEEASDDTAKADSGGKTDASEKAETTEEAEAPAEASETKDVTAAQEQTEAAEEHVAESTEHTEAPNEHATEKHTEDTHNEAHPHTHTPAPTSMAEVTKAAKETFKHSNYGFELNEFKQVQVVPGLDLKTSVFGSTFYVMTGTHGTHVAIGVLWLFSMLVYSYSGRLTPRHAVDVEIAGLYWHFVDIVWIVIFTVVYLVEYI